MQGGWAFIYFGVNTFYSTKHKSDQRRWNKISLILFLIAVFQARF